MFLRRSWKIGLLASLVSLCGWTGDSQAQHRSSMGFWSAVGACTPDKPANVVYTQFGAFNKSATEHLHLDCGVPLASYQGHPELLYIGVNHFDNSPTDDVICHAAITNGSTPYWTSPQQATYWTFPQFSGLLGNALISCRIPKATAGQQSGLSDFAAAGIY